MNTISVKDARQQFAKLVNAARNGRSTAIVRRGKPVAQIGPVDSGKRPKLPDLAAFRGSLGKPVKKSLATIRHLRELERY
ncbi:MAG: type II toxin-antitoxin system prevent-host-death family antitoxin [Phycisphaerales bacterium]|nr:type II toxin-antitoxin system prevent-host-death family antitoxin [Phycisphaerales bacterium]